MDDVGDGPGAAFFGRDAVDGAAVDDVGQVQVQRAAESDVEDLRSAADGEEGDLASEHQFGDGQLVAVPVRVQGVDGFVAAAAVEGGVEVAAAGEQDAVEAVERPPASSSPGGRRTGSPPARRTAAT